MLSVASDTKHDILLPFSGISSLIELEDIV